MSLSQVEGLAVGCGTPTQPNPAAGPGEAWPGARSQNSTPILDSIAPKFGSATVRSREAPAATVEYVPSDAVHPKHISFDHHSTRMVQGFVVEFRTVTVVREAEVIARPAGKGRSVRPL